MATREAYGGLLHETMPSVIETSAQYDSLSERLSGLVRKGRARSSEENQADETVSHSGAGLRRSTGPFA
jgi:hypothetical protein